MSSIGIPMTEEGAEKVKEFVPSKGLTTFEAQQLLQKWGRNELEDKKKSKVSLFNVLEGTVILILCSCLFSWSNCGNRCLS